MSLDRGDYYHKLMYDRHLAYYIEPLINIFRIEINIPDAPLMS